MKEQADILFNLAKLFTADAGADRQAAADVIHYSIKQYARLNEEAILSVSPLANGGDEQFLSNDSFPVNHIDGDQLMQLNLMLPWGALTPASKGRTLGQAWTTSKRNNVASLLDSRQIALNEVIPFAGKDILEVGCFEGIHTIGCVRLGGNVTAIDSRVENVIKTVVRLWAYGAKADVQICDLEEKSPRHLPHDWDILHHIGVLYHLTNPVEHLEFALPRTKAAVLLDTHVVGEEDKTLDGYVVGDHTYAYKRYGESRSSPFAGMSDHAKWLRLDDIIAMFHRHSFSDVRVQSDRQERNGRRVTVWAFRE